MARQLRIQYPGAFYHVYSRGNQKQPIFLSEDDRFFFLKILRDAHDRLAARIHVYCLMPNHYHLALETPSGNLSRIMHFINAAYSMYLNVKHGRCGHLFQGRFKAILVEAESYARTLTIYIHGNPVRKALVKSPEDFEWSSARAYYGLTEPPSWLRMDLVMGCFGHEAELLRKEHGLVLRSSHEAPEDTAFLRASRVGILGNDQFVERIRRSFLGELAARVDHEVPELRRLREKPDISRILAEVTAALGTGNRLIKKTVIYIAHKNTDLKLSEIGAIFDIGPAAAGVAYRKLRAAAASSEPLKRTIKDLEEKLFAPSNTN